MSWGPKVKGTPVCACGCGEPVRVNGRRPSTFKKGHHKRKHGNPAAFDPKQARRNEHLFRTFGLTVEDFTARLKAQNGRCAICLTSDPGKARGGRTRRWCVDHDHKTGKIRGLLCHGCNSGIGSLSDDPVLCERAAQYLRGVLCA